MEWSMIHGDSRHAIPDEEFDLVVTSPPYNVGVDYAGHDDRLSLGAWRALIKTVFTEAWDRLAEGGRLAVNVQHGVGRSPMIPLGFHVEGIGHDLPDALYRGCIVWDKGPVNTTAWGSWLSPSNPVLRGRYEQVHVWSKGSLTRNGGPGDLTEREFTTATMDVWNIGAESAREDHPAPFPIALAERLIKLYSWPGDRVLDPFAGIGSSGVAANRLGRSWVGIDTSEEYCTIARERIETDELPAEIAIPDDVMAEAERFARVLARGAAEVGVLEVRRVQLSPSAGPWERYRRTLSNQVTTGAYGVVQRRDASRVFWTTADAPALQRWAYRPIRMIKAPSVEALEAKLLLDVARVLADATGDRRTRAVTPRGFSLS